MANTSSMARAYDRFMRTPLQTLPKPLQTLPKPQKSQKSQKSQKPQKPPQKSQQKHNTDLEKLVEKLAEKLKKLIRFGRIEEGHNICVDVKTGLPVPNGHTYGISQKMFLKGGFPMLEQFNNDNPITGLIIGKRVENEDGSWEEGPNLRKLRDLFCERYKLDLYIYPDPSDGNELAVCLNEELTDDAESIVAFEIAKHIVKCLLRRKHYYLPIYESESEAAKIQMALSDEEFIEEYLRISRSSHDRNPILPIPEPPEPDFEDVDDEPSWDSVDDEPYYDFTDPSPPLPNEEPADEEPADEEPADEEPADEEPAAEAEEAGEDENPAAYVYPVYHKGGPLFIGSNPTLKDLYPYQYPYQYPYPYSSTMEYPQYLYQPQYLYPQYHPQYFHPISPPSVWSVSSPMEHPQYLYPQYHSQYCDPISPPPWGQCGFSQ